MTQLPTHDQRRRTVLLLEHARGEVVDILHALPGGDARRRGLWENLHRIDTALARVLDGEECR